MHLPVSSGTPRFANLQLFSQLAPIKTGADGPSSHLLLYCHSIYKQASPIGSNAEQKLFDFAAAMGWIKTQPLSQ
jgi:hypothetical protein